MTLAIDDAGNRFTLTGGFDLVVPVLWADGTFSISFGVLWNAVTSRVEIAGMPEVVVNLSVHAWVWIVSAVFFGAIFAAVGAAAGPVGAVIGGIIGAAFGVVIAYDLQEITRVVARIELGGGAERLAGTPLLPLPLLSPTRLRTQNVHLDDLVIVSRPEMASVLIRGDLRITDRQYLPTSGPFSRVRLTWQGEFQAVPTHLASPLHFLWTLNGSLLAGEGEIPVTRGVLRYQVNGARCLLTTTHGTSLNERLCAEVRDAGEFRVFSCRLLQVEGERTEIEEVDPLDRALIGGPIRLPPNLIPDPAPDVIFDPEAVARVQADYVSAVVRGMGIEPGSLDIPTAIVG